MTSMTPSPFDQHNLNTSSRLQLTSNVKEHNKEAREKNPTRDGKLNTSDAGAFMHVIKGSLGTGLLGMPYAFHNIGLLGGLIGTSLIALICAHCTHLIVKCSQELCYIRGVSAMSYMDTVESAFNLGAGGRFSKWAPTMRSMANSFTFVAYYGVNTVYVILIASTFKHVLENHCEFTWNIRWYVAALTLVLLPIGLVRHIKFLVPFSVFANLCMFVGSVLTLYLCCQDLPPPSSRPMFVEVARWPLFLSTAMFGMEAIGVIMPIENAVRHPSHFLGCPSVLNLSMMVVAIMYIVVGSLGYIKYGDDVEGSINLNLPEDAFSEVVKILIGLAILFTYPLQLTASTGVVWETARSWFSPKNEDFGYYTTKGILVLGTVLIALAVPNLSPVMSLVGAVGLSGLGLLIPTITEAATYWNSMGRITVAKQVVLIIIWAIATVTGSVTSINDIIEQYDIKT